MIYEIKFLLSNQLDDSIKKIYENKLNDGLN